jgi:hypothetical protein
MNQPTIKTAFKLILVVVITFGLSLALQSVLGEYNGPLCAPPGCNVPAPVNVGSSTALVHTQQYMYDGLSVSDESVIATSSGLGVAGNLIVSSDALFVDGVNPKRQVGIGATTTTPLAPAKLTVDMSVWTNLEGIHIRRAANPPFNTHYAYLNIEDENANPIFKVHESGNVGIGTGSPSGKFTVQNNDSSLITWNRNGEIVLQNTFGAVQPDTSWFGIQFNSPSGGRAAGIAFINTDVTEDYGRIDFGARGATGWNSSIMTIKSNNVGIGNTNPSYTLDVTGDINFTGTLRQNGTAFAGGYTLNLSTIAYNPVDSAVDYFGNAYKVPTNDPNVFAIFIPRAGTIKVIHLRADATGGVTGTGEAWPIYVRVNNTTDYLIRSTASGFPVRDWDNTTMNAPVNAGGYILIKIVNPTWVTNPTNVIFSGYVYIE